MTEPTSRKKNPPKTPQSATAHGAGDEALAFESSIERLEKIVEQLEQGDLSLEDTLRAFETGVAMAKNCATQLDAAEQRIEVLTREGGELFTTAFKEAEASEDDEIPF